MTEESLFETGSIAKLTEKHDSTSRRLISSLQDEWPFCIGDMDSCLWLVSISTDTKRPLILYTLLVYFPYPTLNDVYNCRLTCRQTALSLH
jgi:hypothetical protein